MSRTFVSDDGEVLLFPQHKRRHAFLAAETITHDLGVEAVVVHRATARARMLAVYLHTGERALADEQMREALAICKQMLKQAL